MSLIQGYPLVQVKQLQNPDTVFETIVGLIVKLAEHGLIHCDFNEFNIMIDDNENVTMIDFHQMVSVSHRNAQMYFDRDVECVYKFFSRRFHASFNENKDEDEGSEDLDENGKPCFSSIAKSAGVLDKELAASGFTKKDQDEIEKFVEGGNDEQGDASSSDEEDGRSECDEEMGGIEGGVDSLHLVEQEMMINSDVNAVEKEDDSGPIIREAIESETSQPTEQEEDDNSPADRDPVLMKQLNKQRRRAISSAKAGPRALSSRNSYKDKGGKASQNSKIQKQLTKW